MPGSLQLAQPTTVLPLTLNSAFSEGLTWLTNTTDEYPDGRVQMSVQVAQPRRSWSLQKRLNHSDWSTLQTFYEARKGQLQPFYWYPNKADHDASGVSTTGRFTVRFAGSLQSEYSIAKHVVSLSLIQVA